jgi:hypothetical protein
MVVFRRSSHRPAVVEPVDLGRAGHDVRALGKQPAVSHREQHGGIRVALDGVQNVGRDADRQVLSDWLDYAGARGIDAAMIFRSGRAASSVRARSSVCSTPATARSAAGSGTNLNRLARAVLAAVQTRA